MISGDRIPSHDSLVISLRILAEVLAGFLVDL
jgi:hypothetical protein